MLKLGINRVSNAEYHADNEYLSSSNLKTLLKDPQQFYQEKILGNREPQEEKSSFTEGSLTHSMILEPHLVNSEFAFFDGLRKQGADYERFVSENPGKLIISKAQKIRVDTYVAAYKRNKLAVSMIKGGFSEQTVCVDVGGVPIKIRADYINVDQGYVADVKTSAMPVDVDSARLTARKWAYDLSAALYVAAVEQHYQRPFDFYLIMIGKQEGVCYVYRMSKATLEQGTMQVVKALSIYRECKKTGIWSSNNQPEKIKGADLDLSDVLEL